MKNIRQCSEINSNVDCFNDVFQGFLKFLDINLTRFIMSDKKMCLKPKICQWHPLLAVRLIDMYN